MLYKLFNYCMTLIFGDDKTYSDNSLKDYYETMRRIEKRHHKYLQ